MYLLHLALSSEPSDEHTNLGLTRPQSPQQTPCTHLSIFREPRFFFFFFPPRQTVAVFPSATLFFKGLLVNWILFFFNNTGASHTARAG